MATETDDLSEWRKLEIVQREYETGHLLKRVYWQLVGMPSAEEILHRRSDSPFTLAEGERIREIVREEQES